MRTAASLPTVLLSIVLTIMGTYYMTADKERISAFFSAHLPRALSGGTAASCKKNLVHSLFGQIKSQLLVSLIIMTFLMLAFVLFRVRYGLLLGFFIGLADALPVIGAGLFLIPWAVVRTDHGPLRDGRVLCGGVSVRHHHPPDRRAAHRRATIWGCIRWRR